MAINKANTTAEEQSFEFLINQSSILHTIDTNKITANGINVRVDKPKRGDVMCITRYKENGVLLGADKQKIVWIDGSSIEPTQLSQEYEPAGICLVVNGNKAIVRYPEEKSFKWAVSERWGISGSMMNDGKAHYVFITLNGKTYSKTLRLTTTDTASRQAFVAKLNAWFLANDPTYSAELVELDTDLPASDTSDTKDGNSYRNRVIVNAKTWNTLNIAGLAGGVRNETREIAKHIKAVNYYFINNGFTRNYDGGCCRAEYYDYVQEYGSEPTGTITSINTIYPVRLVDFDNPYCQILRDNFANYDEYIDSLMVKYPCGAGTIAEFPSGKENTYKLADCTYLDNETGKQEILYPAANWVASISLNAPNLGKGNWWIPSTAEMVQMMRDITYGTSLWETEPDIVNSVIAKFILAGTGSFSWSMFSADTDRWTSSRYDNTAAYFYSSLYGTLFYWGFSYGSEYAIAPITCLTI